MSDFSRLLPKLPPEQQAIRDKCFHPTGTFVEFKQEEIEQSIPDRFERLAARYPQRVAVRTRSQTFSYDELNRAANRVAHAIRDQSEVGQQPVAVLFENGAPFVIASLGVLKAGEIQVSLESGFPRARLKYVLEQSKAAMLVTDNANFPLARQLGNLPLINIDQIDGRFSGENPGVRVRPDAFGYIGYTSGSTGEPKGMVWKHRGLLHAVMRHTNMSHLCADDRLVMFRASLRACLYALLNGAAYYPVALRREEAPDLADWLIEEKITVYRAAVSAFRGFASALTGTEEFPHLRLILLFGEPIYPTDVELYRRHFTRASILAGSLGCSEFDDYAYYFVDRGTPLPGGVVPAGYPIADAEILLLDDSGRPVGPDQVGEIAISSRFNPVGYWQRPDLTQARFLRRAGRQDERIYLTGDLGRMRSDRCLLHQGRKDFQVKIRGYRVELTEVETALLDIDGVKQAVVVGWEDAPGSKRLIAYIVMVPGGPHIPTVTELRRILADKLPDYMVPSTFITLDALPLTATGKVDRRALPPPDRTRPALETPFAAPRTPVEEKLAQIWAGVLGLDRVGMHDSFLDLGGDSLLATQVISRVLAQFEVRLPLRFLFDEPTVAEMAVLLVQNYTDKVEPQNLNRILAELETLSEQEARSLLSKRSG